jgi:hypothetical protein
MSEQLKAAGIRAGIAAIAAGLASASAYLYGEVDGRMALAGFVTALSPILVRVLEGVYDTNRADNGDIRPSDVGVHN